MITTVAAMEENERIGRRNAMPHNPAALRALADNIQEHANSVRRAAELLDRSAPGLFVGLNHLKAVEAGLTAIRNVVHEVEMKIDNKKFIKITIAEPQATAPKKPKKRP